MFGRRFAISRPIRRSCSLLTNPLLTSAASWLTGEKHVIIEFRPATIARIDFEQITPEPRGTVQWTLHASE